MRTYRLTNTYRRNTSQERMAETRTALYQRNEVFWLGFSAVLLGVLLPRILAFGGINSSRPFVVTGVAS